MLIPRDEALFSLLRDGKRLLREDAELEDRFGDVLRDLAACLASSGAMDSVPPGDAAGWGVDGGIALSRSLRAARATIAVVALPRRGEALCVAETMELPHSPGGEAAVRARLAMRELVAAVEIAGRPERPLVLLDGSFRSAFVSVNQGLAAAAEEEIQPLLADVLPLWADALDALRELPNIVSVPKLTSAYGITRHRRITKSASDRWIFSRILPPGRWISVRRAYAVLGVPDEPAVPFRCVVPFLPEIEPRLRDAGFRLMDALESGFVRPDHGGAACLFESCGLPGRACAAVAFDLPSPRLCEPLLLLGADRMTKGICRVHKAIVDPADPYRTEG